MSQSSDGMVKKAAIIVGALIVVVVLLKVVFKDKIAGSNTGVVQQVAPSPADAERMERTGPAGNPAAAAANAKAIASEKR